MAEIRNGKRPLSQKSAPATINPDDVFMNPLGLDEEIKKTIESKGYSYRFINYKQFVDMGGSHQAYWQPVSMKKLKEMGYDKMDSQSFLHGNDTDGYIRRGDLVLAIRSKDINDKHKQYLRQEAGRAKHTQAIHAEELRELVRSKGGQDKVKVYEGYEDEGEE